MDINNPIGMKSFQPSQSPFIMSPSRFGGASAVGGGYWKELGRNELGSSASEIIVSGLTSHKYYKILCYLYTTAGTDISEALQFNANSNSVYARRSSANGNESTQVNLSQLNNITQGHGPQEMFEMNVANVAGQEKLAITHSVNGNIGTSNVPKRNEHVAKFVPSPDADITQVRVFDNGAGSYDYAIGSQIIVLGWEDTVTHALTDNFWKYGNRVELGTAGTNIELSSFGSHEWLMVRVFAVSAGNNADMSMQFNNVTSGYAWRRSSNGASDSVSTSSSFIGGGGSAGTDTAIFKTMFICNKSDKEKLAMIHEVNGETIGAGTTAGRAEVVGKLANTSSQITTIDFNSSSQNYASGSFAEVWYAD